MSARVGKMFVGGPRAKPKAKAKAKARAKPDVRPKKLTLYLGWDGAYVLSKHPLSVHIDNSEGTGLKYLSTGVMHSIADLGAEGRVVFGDLKLKQYEVVKVELTIRKAR